MFLLRLHIVIDREHHTRIAFDAHIDSHGTLGELRRLVHMEASHHSDFNVNDPDRISFMHYPATRYGANGDIRVTSDAFLGFFASSYTTLWVRIEAAVTLAEPPPATSPAPQLAVAPPQLAIAPTSPSDAGSGTSSPRIVEIEAGTRADATTAHTQQTPPSQHTDPPHSPPGHNSEIEDTGGADTVSVSCYSDDSEELVIEEEAVPGSPPPGSPRPHGEATQQNSAPTPSGEGSSPRTEQTPPQSGMEGQRGQQAHAPTCQTPDTPISADTTAGGSLAQASGPEGTTPAESNTPTATHGGCQSLSTAAQPPPQHGQERARAHLPSSRAPDLSHSTVQEGTTHGSGFGGATWEPATNIPPPPTNDGGGDSQTAAQPFPQPGNSGHTSPHGLHPSLNRLGLGGEEPAVTAPAPPAQAQASSITLRDRRDAFCPQCGAPARSACELVVPDCAAVSCPRGCQPYTCLCRHDPPGYPSLPNSPASPPLAIPDHDMDPGSEPEPSAYDPANVLPWPSPNSPPPDDEPVTAETQSQAQTDAAQSSSAHQISPPADPPPTAQPSPPWRWRALVLFSGPCTEATHLPDALESLGFGTTPIDILIGGEDHDLLRREVAEPILKDIRGGEYTFIALGTPCSTYSVLRSPRLRSKGDPTGAATAPEEWQQTLSEHNRLAEFSAQVIEAAEESNTPWLLENPADVGVPGSVCYWEEKSDCASLFDMPCIAAALDKAQALPRTFAMCAFGAPYRKWTTIFFGGALRKISEPLAYRGCPHGLDKHPQRLDGHDSAGNSLATKASAYPPELCVELANYAALAAEDGQAARTAAAAKDPADGGIAPPSTRTESTDTQLPSAPSSSNPKPSGAYRDGVWIEGGRMSDGPALTPSINALIDQARRTPASFASLRNLAPEGDDVLRRAPIPDGLHPQDANPDKKRKRKPPGPPLKIPDPSPEAIAYAALPDEFKARRPSGKIRIQDLYLPGVYKRVEAWLDQAAHAMCVAESMLGYKGHDRRDLPHVPTLVIPQSEQPIWARDIIWDCADPLDCKPLQRSTAHTIFPGEKQLNRANLRQMAQLLNWPDTDIIEQACGGGVETRSQCERITVLAFHHPTLLDELQRAQHQVEKEWREGWTDRPIPHLPFVPCRLQPRNVVLQERVRVKPVERWEAPPRHPVVESYLKARVTLDCSYGGTDSVNATVPTAEREISLPRVQHLARAVAIIDLAARDANATAARMVREGELQDWRELKAISYNIDEEMAYYYVPAQVMDHWENTYFWFDHRGDPGVCRSWRLGTGGAWSPNKFQRISTIVMAWAQRERRDFDREHPPPLPVRLWGMSRANSQIRGDLPPGKEQTEPAYCHVYIDDNAGTALNDRVPTPPYLQGIHIDPTPTQVLGGEFPEADSRVLVHAKILLCAMTMAGFYAAPDKILIGDPLVSLGFSISRSENRLKLPQVKQASMLDAIVQLQKAAIREGKAMRRYAERLVGRLVNVSQIAPELKPYLSGGFRAITAGWCHKRGMRKPPFIKFKKGSEAHAAWLELLQAAGGIIEINDGVPLAPQLHFPREGSIISTTDASGTDGFGGYVFMPGQPDDIYIVSEPWPEWARRARARSDCRVTERSDEAELELSMPAAELLASYLVPLAVVDTLGLYPHTPEHTQPRIISISDCKPATYVLNAATSGEPTMRDIVCESRRFSRYWLGVAVPREANPDADMLSHPETAWQLVPGKTSARVHRIEVPYWALEEVEARLRGRAQYWAADHRGYF